MKKNLRLLFALCCLVTETGIAQCRVLHNFNDTLGANPYGSLSLSGGVLYGMTYEGGGLYDSGCVFSMDTNGSRYTELIDFNGLTGMFPPGDVTISGSVMYGMTAYRGYTGYLYGNIFSMDTNGSGYLDLFNFSGTNGGNPSGNLTLIGNKMFGLATYGGSFGNGTLFSINTDGSNYSVLHDFDNTDGGSPAGSLTYSQGILYGLAGTGGLYGKGAIFSIDTNGSGGYNDIHDFNGTNGSTPLADLILIGSKLYGMTYEGGANNSGCIFSININGSVYKDLRDFNAINGEYPLGDLIFNGKKLYGMTSFGGSGNQGVIFSIDTTGMNYRDVFDFNVIDGAVPYGSLILSGNVFYGMTTAGGTYDYGTIFSFKDTTTTDTVITTSINKILPSPRSVNLFPNPNSGIFTLAFTHPESGSQTIEIYNVLGEKIYSQLSIVNYPLSINLSAQPNGVYLYRVLDENGNLPGTGKLVIQK